MQGSLLSNELQDRSRLPEPTQLHEPGQAGTVSVKVLSPGLLLQEDRHRGEDGDARLRLCLVLVGRRREPRPLRRLLLPLGPLRLLQLH